MGLFSKWNSYKENRHDKKIAKCEKLITNPKSIKEDRMAALDFLADYKDAATTVPILLKRFEYSLEHGILDTREKELALKGILEKGEESLPFVVENLKATTKIAWSIKIIKKIGSEDQLVSSLLDSIDFGDVEFDQAKVDKNYDILCYLVDFKVSGLADKLKHFLTAHDERVRFAAVEAIAQQEDADVPQILEPFLADSSSENGRIRQSVAEAFTDHSWALAEPGILNNSGGLTGFRLDQDNRLQKN